MVGRVGEALTSQGVAANGMQARCVVHTGTWGDSLEAMVGRHSEAEVSPVWLQLDRRRCRQGGWLRRRWYFPRCRMLACREWKGVPKDPDSDAGSRLGGHAELSLPAAAFRRQLLHNPVAGTGIEGEAVLATERGTAQ